MNVNAFAVKLFSRKRENGAKTTYLIAVLQIRIDVFYHRNRQPDGISWWVRQTFTVLISGRQFNANKHVNDTRESHPKETQQTPFLFMIRNGTRQRKYATVPRLHPSVLRSVGRLPTAVPANAQNDVHGKIDFFAVSSMTPRVLEINIMLLLSLLGTLFYAFLWDKIQTQLWTRLIVSSIMIK